MLLLAACTTQSDSLGKEGDGNPDAQAKDGRNVTCTQGGKTYQVGDTVASSACTTCVCQQDGTLGMCTGVCPPDGGHGDAGGAGFDAGKDMAFPDAAVETSSCGPIGPVASTVTCLTAKDQCVPSTCYCSSTGLSCSADCRALPLCADAAPDLAAADVPAVADGGVDMASPDAAAGTSSCGPIGPVASTVTCLTSKDHCVPSTCYCSSTGLSCSADCRALPLCADAGSDGSAADTDYSCRTDDDCCIVIDTCINRAYLYSQAPGAAGQPTLQPHPSCNNCIPPSVQVRCTMGQCVGESMGYTPYPLLLHQSHCGSVASPDAGATSSDHSLHGGPPETSWGCS